ncbi:cytochrome c-type biogenesis protein CcmH [Qipengyuania sp. DY56-A-20]|jgi:cytochrome c-type biogenesis protein CcmH/NrfF|uniref:Cytochrome c-type biogenesis protein n=1 Tax=Qipengyuania benthica TaxID=3067651 RepID=A0ABT9H706_9SPHN|nr:cytochrome c-type biogenesis protein [Qipengyuania sp. DY56-A-20]MBU1255088.1 cytochrome c-type biogenesis protein CcmH [Alphaproteobacteria bacterium]MBU1605863.1 cytochrome c-type biogenesis protein CcmH [Alphaproteobacteria bacterium]MDP4539098.1 cytochrome c-type biogenesis protein CcmH [Qipengyuania sp. DY56-A-20]
MTAIRPVLPASLRRSLLTLLVLCLGAPLLAQQSLPPAPFANRQLDDPAQEAVALELMATLRCLECQSQSIHDSDSPMAGDMRHQVRIRVAAGENPESIRAWLMERYGDYVSYEPQMSSTTWPLFAVPLLILLVAGAIFWRRFGKRT